MRRRAYIFTQICDVECIYILFYTFLTEIVESKNIGPMRLVRSLFPVGSRRLITALLFSTYSATFTLKYVLFYRVFATDFTKFIRDTELAPPPFAVADPRSLYCAVLWLSRLPSRLP